MALRRGTSVALTGALVVGVAFGMARYIYGLTLPAVRGDLNLPGWLAGVMGGATFAGFVAALFAIGPLSRARGPRAPTVLGAALGAAGAALVAIATGPGVLAVGVVATGASAGLVWSPFSDLVSRTAPPERRSLLLSLVTTGTSGGLILLGLVGLASGPLGWRVAWGITAVLLAAAAVTDLRVVPRLEPWGDSGRPADLTMPARLRQDAARVRAPLGYATLFISSTVIYFTYATAAVEDRGLPEAVGSLVYVAIGITGCAGLATGLAVQRVGVVRVGGACLGLVAVALALLALPVGGAAVVLGSAALLGPGFMGGSALLAIWTWHALPERPSDGFTLALIAGSIGSVAAPPVVGALAPRLGLEVVLAATALALGVAAVLLLLRWPRGHGRFAPNRGSGDQHAARHERQGGAA